MISRWSVANTCLLMFTLRAFTANNTHSFPPSARTLTNCINHHTGRSEARFYPAVLGPQHTDRPYLRAKYLDKRPLTHLQPPHEAHSKTHSFSKQARHTAQAHISSSNTCLLFYITNMKIPLLITALTSLAAALPSTLTTLTQRRTDCNDCKARFNNCMEVHTPSPSPLYPYHETN